MENSIKKKKKTNKKNKIKKQTIKLLKHFFRTIY